MRPLRLIRMPILWSSIRAIIDRAVEESLDAIGEALAENGKVIVTGCLGAKDGGDVIRHAHPQVLAVTGPQALPEVMSAVHKHLPQPHDPFTSLVPRREYG